MTPASILVCRLSALGDIVLTLPVVSALRESFPNARIEYLAREPHGRVLRSVAALDELRMWPGPGEALPAAVRDRAFDVVVDLSASGRSRRLLRGVRAGRLLRVAKQTLERFWFVHGRWIGADGSRLRPVVDRYFETVAPLGVLRSARQPRFDVASPSPDGPVLLAPGAGRATKCWPAERFVEIAGRLATAGRRVRVVGSPAEADLVARVAAGAPDAECVVVEDLAELPERVAGCPVALTNDSGLLHVAEACGAVVLALFGPTHPRLGFAPLGPNSRVVHSGISCSPCDLHGPSVCPRGHHRCLGDLSVDLVWSELRNLGEAVSGC